MSAYTPDCWEVVVVTSPEHGKIYKVLASWYGGFAGSDSWKLSSGIEKVIEHDDHFELPQSSGSVYLCYKGARKLSGLSASMLASFKKKLADSTSGTTIELFEGEVTSLELTS